MNSSLKQVTQSDITHISSESKSLVLLFKVDWCGECKLAESILCEIRKEFYHSVSFYKIDIEAECEVSTVFGIRQTPSLLISNKMDLPEIIEGIKPKYFLREALGQIVMNHQWRNTYWDITSPVGKPNT